MALVQKHCLVQAKEQRQAKEAQISKAQMDAARRGGISWGMDEEAALEENAEDVTEGLLLERLNDLHHVEQSPG